jgi:arylsulfatase A-like enzyme
MKPSIRMKLLWQRRLLIGLLLLASSGPFGCEGAGPSDDRWNLILISIDSLRADHLHSYGYRRKTSPSIDAFAKEGVLFENAIAQSPWTLPSHASLLTSLYARTHGADEASHAIGSETSTLASALQGAGYRTHAVVSGTFMWSRFGFNIGFDTYDDSLIQDTFKKNHEATTTPRVHARIQRILDDASGPFFLFAHYWDVHYDYIPPPPFARRFGHKYDGEMTSNQFIKNPAIHKDMNPRDLRHLVALYDGEIAWVDSYIGKLIADLKRRNLYDRTVIVLTADHGDEFFEHGEKGHQHSLYQELLHVPLIVRVPKAEGGRRVTDRVELIDVMPTLLNLLGVAAPAGIQGRSFEPLLTGESWEERPSISETTMATKSRDAKKNSDSWAIYRGQYKLIVFAENHYPIELYDLARDPGEKEPLADRELASRLLEDYQGWIEQVPVADGDQTIELEEGIREMLESLGYLDP